MTHLSEKAPQQGTRRIVFPAMLAGLVIILAEIVSLIFGLAMKRSLFSGEATYFASIDEAGFNAWKLSPWFDTELGWNVPQHVAQHNDKNCLGQDILYRFSLGARLNDGSAASPEVALFG